jgi:hypothetical protein
MSAARKMDTSPVALLDAIKRQGKEWDVLAPQYGVTNLDPPWKSSLTGICEALSVGGPLPALDRRKAEDVLADTVYKEIPTPERDLLSLVHIMVKRGLVAEDDLAIRMKTVRSRLQRA